MCKSIDSSRNVNQKSRRNQHNQSSNSNNCRIATARQPSQPDLNKTDHRKHQERQPITDPKAEPNIPNLSTMQMMSALKALSASLLLRNMMASLKPWAIKKENRKKLKETNSKTWSFRSMPIPTSEPGLFSRLCCPGLAKDRPTKTATVKREFTLTRPSRAVTWTLVLDVVLLKLSWLWCSLGFCSELRRQKGEDWTFSQSETQIKRKLGVRSYKAIERNE